MRRAAEWRLGSRVFLPVILVAMLAACSADDDFGSVTPYSATVPAGWTSSGAIRGTGLDLRENDEVWVPDDQVERAMPSEALVFCSARPVKNAPATQCDLQRITGWTDPGARRSRPTELCNKHPGEEISAAGQFDRVPGVARAVRMVDAAGRAYLAMYVRRTSQPENSRAAQSIRTMCPFQKS